MPHLRPAPAKVGQGPWRSSSEKEFISRGGALPLLVVLIGILGGAMAFNFIGIFLSPTILAILYALMREWSPGEYQRQPAGQDRPLVP